MNFIFRCDSKQKTGDSLASVADTSKQVFFFFLFSCNTLKQSLQQQRQDMKFVHHNQCADRVMPAPPVLAELFKRYHLRWIKNKGDQRKIVVCEVSHTSSYIAKSRRMFHIKLFKSFISGLHTNPKTIAIAWWLCGSCILQKLLLFLVWSSP